MDKVTPIINNGNLQFVHTSSNAHDSIKKPTSFGRAITIYSRGGSIVLDRDSLINYLNAREKEHAELGGRKPHILRKGGSFLGLKWGSSDKEIHTVFETIVSKLPDSSVHVDNAPVHLGKAEYKEGMYYYDLEMYEDALAAFLVAGEKGNPDAYFMAGQIYEKGLGGFFQDLEKANSYYEKAKNLQKPL